MMRAAGARERVRLGPVQRLHARPVAPGGNRLEPDAPRLVAVVFPDVRDARRCQEAVDIGFALPDSEEGPFAEVRLQQPDARDVRRDRKERILAGGHRPPEAKTVHTTGRTAARKQLPPPERYEMKGRDHGLSLRRPEPWNTALCSI